MKNMTYGERLRWARKRVELTQQDLAKVSGVKQVSISKIERGEQLGSSFDSVLAHHLGINAYWLTTGEGEPVGQILSEHEASLIKAYKLSSPEQREYFEFLRQQALRDEG